MNAAEMDIAGCEIEPIGHSECLQVVAWLTGDESAPPANIGDGLIWALAHSDGGVTWGKYDQESGRWQLGCDFVPEVSPRLSPEALHELRVFGEPAELLIWRSDGHLRGRLLRDRTPNRKSEAEMYALRPCDRLRILRGNRVRLGVASGFTWVVDVAGAEQALPLELDEQKLRRREARLRVRHYWIQDPEDGTVRIAVTRLVALTVGGNHDAG